MTEALRASRLTVHDGSQKILDDAFCTLDAGGIAALVGGPASGKSTFIRTLLGQTSRSSGELSVCGFDPELRPQDVRRAVTYIGTPDVLEPHLTTRQNTVHLLQLAGAEVPARSEIDRALRDADVPDRDIDRTTDRVAPLVAFSIWLALARLRSSSLILLDAPTEKLSASDASHLAALLRDQTSGGTAVFVVTRDAVFAEECTSTILFVESGRFLPISPAVRDWHYRPGKTSRLPGNRIDAADSRPSGLD